MSMPWPISFCLITLNEEEHLGRCLRSFEGLADEIVVLDSGSRDRTQRITEQAGARFIHQDWLGYVKQKNTAIDLATHRWVFSIDADEALSPALREELLGLKAGSEPGQVSGFSMPRCVLYRGRWIRHGDWYPDRLVRLFRKDRARFAGGKVHERLEVEGTIQALRNDLEHYSFRDVEDFKKRSDHYAQLWAETQFELGKRGGALAPISHAVFRWLRGYVLRAGFMEGGRGLEIATLCAREVFMKYRALRRMSGG